MWESIILAPPPPPPALLTHDCNTIARLLRNMRPPSGPSFGVDTTKNISNGNIVSRPSRGSFACVAGKGGEDVLLAQRRQIVR